jgi:hypothetical protein
MVELEIPIIMLPILCSALKNLYEAMKFYFLFETAKMLSFHMLGMLSFLFPYSHFLHRRKYYRVVPLR